MDKDLRDILFILYSLKVSPLRYVSVFRNKGRDTGSVNRYFLKNREACSAGQLALEGMGSQPGEGKSKFMELVGIIESGDATALYIGGPGYPSVLEEIYNPPPVLFSRGRGELGNFNIAVVGSRKCTRYGRDAAAYISGSLSEMGITVVSGMALGIDSTAHREAVCRKGGSIAVMGSGLDVIYPPENKELYHRIIKNGAVVTEFFFGAPPLRQNFPVRNRIISGISRGVIIVEAGRRSGAMITGEMALEQDREVFAVPGSIFSNASRGCHRLIKNGARLVDSVDDILEEFQGLFKKEARKDRRSSIREKAGLPQDLPVDAGAVYRSIGYNPSSLEQLCAQCSMPVKRMLQALAILEMEGLIKEEPSNHYARSD